MVMPVLVTAGFLLAAAGLVAGYVTYDSRRARSEGEQERGWTVEELQAMARSLPLAPVLAPQLERLPFEEEADAPLRAREWGTREYQQVLAKWEARISQS